MSFGKELFEMPHRELIQTRLSSLFYQVELENSRAGKVGMEVGNARENIIIALLMSVYGEGAIEIPSTTEPEADVLVNSHPLSIKTITKKSKAIPSIKLSWTVDKETARNFVTNYRPSIDLLFVEIFWSGKGGFYLIPKKAQEDVLDYLKVEQYLNLPKEGTNPRGIEITKEAMSHLLNHSETMFIKIVWQPKDITQAEEMRARYHRWLELWGGDANV